MTIKQRIFFANIAVLLFLLFYASGVLLFSINSLMEAYKAYDESSLDIADDTAMSSYELQTIIENFAEVTRNSHGKMNTTSALSILEDLSKTGTKVMVVVDGSVNYITDGYKYDTLLYDAEEFLGTQVPDTITCYKEKGYFFSSDFESDGHEYRIALLNENITIAKNTGTRGEYVSNLIKALRTNVQSFLFLGAIAVIIINLSLVSVVSNSIMKPLNMLKEGAQKIFDGDLDFTIEYGKNDEISEVLESFEKMRRQLQESYSEQKRYEDNRKRLIAGISHDLRTPLTSIKGYVSGLLDGIADTDEKRERYLKTIYSTVDDMNQLVEDLFLFSKLDIDKLPFTFEEVDINEFMSMFCDEIKFSLEKKSVVVTYADLSKGHTYVQLDRDKFARVLLNVADNTVKYKKNTLGNLYVTLERLDGFVEIRMKDDGIGVSNDVLGKMFESFYRNDPARTNPVKGSGLGLAIAKSIIESHGGKIFAESNLGEGLTIVIRIPYDKTKQTS